MPRPPDPKRLPDFELSPLATVAASLALGIALAGPRPTSLPGMFLPVACGACLLAGLIALRAGRRTISFLLVLGGFAAAGATAARLFEFRFAPDHVSQLVARGVDLGKPLRLEGRIVSTPLESPYGLQFDVDVRRLEIGGRFRKASGKVRLRLQVPAEAENSEGADSLSLQYGDFIRALVQLGQPRIYQNPGAFDFRRWLESIEDVYWTGTIKNPLLVERVTSAGRRGVALTLAEFRRHLLIAVDRMYPPWSASSRRGAVLKAVLFGDRSALDSETVENFRKAGLYHLLVIAGLHVGLLAMLAGIFLHLLRFRDPWSPLLVLVFLLGYSSLVEQRAPTLRAMLMISAYLVSRILYRAHSALNAVGLAAIVLLLHRPPWLFESGFQLSFAAALLIVALAGPILVRTTEPYRRALWALEEVRLDTSFAPRLAQFRLDARSLISGMKSRWSFLERHPGLAAAAVTVPAKAGLWTANMFLFSAILQLGLLLPMSKTFHRVSFSGIGLNALAIPVMTLFLGLSLPAVVLSTAVPPLAHGLGLALSPVMTVLFALTDLPRMPTWLSYRVPGPPSWVAWGFAGATVVAAWSVGRRARLFWASASALGVFIALISLHPFAPRLPRGRLEVTVLDCGGGDGALVVLPDQTTLLIGACGSGARFPRDGMLRVRRWNPGEDVVSPYLWSRGVKKIDILILTDSRDSQFTSLRAIARNFEVREVWYATTTTSAALEEWLELARRGGATVQRVTGGNQFVRGKAVVQVLWPRGPTSNGQAAAFFRPGSDSIALRISDDVSSMALLGDINAKAEEELAGSALPLESQVLQVARHGRKSTAVPKLLARVSPQIAIISADGSSWAQPNSETIGRFQASDAQVFRTDLDGAVTVELTGASIAVHAYRMSAGLGTAGLGGGAMPRVR
jgi:competence protein ComEC